MRKESFGSRGGVALLEQVIERGGKGEDSPYGQGEVKMVRTEVLYFGKLLRIGVVKNLRYSLQSRRK